MVVAVTVGSGAVGSDVAVQAVASLYGNPFIGHPTPPAPSAQFDDGIILSGAIRRFFYNCYILPKQNLAVLGLSPGLADVQCWPARVLVACGDADDLYLPGQLLINRLRAAGHPDADFVPVKRSAHAFDKRARSDVTKTKRDEVYASVSAMIRGTDMRSE